MLNEICSCKCVDLNFAYAGLVYTCRSMIKCCLIYMLVYVYIYIHRPICWLTDVGSCFGQCLGPMVWRDLGPLTDGIDS